MLRALIQKFSLVLGISSMCLVGMQKNSSYTEHMALLDKKIPLIKGIPVKDLSELLQNLPRIKVENLCYEKSLKNEPQSMEMPDIDLLDLSIKRKK